MKTTKNEPLKLEYGIPATTLLLGVLAQADALEGHMRAAYKAAVELEAMLGSGEAAAAFAGNDGAYGEAYAAARPFSAFLDESGLREAGERVN